MFRALFSPPVRLRVIPDRWALVLRPLWMLAFLFAIGAVTAGTIFVLRDTYEVRPAFKSVGYDYDVASDGRVWLEPVGAAGQSGGKVRIVAINGTRVSSALRAGALAGRIEAARGPLIEFTLQNEAGRRSAVRRARDTSVDAEARRTRDLRITARLTSGLLACAALLLCAFLLIRRRPRDPVALLFAFAFSGMAATIDPPIALWMGVGWPPAYDIISSLWFYLLLIALAVFPDGIFIPKSYRWLPAIGILLAIFVSLPNIEPNLTVAVGIISLLAMLVGQGIRYRRLGEGIERQQIKWAAFGFVVGLVLLAAAFTFLAFIPEQSSAQNPWVNLSIVLLFSLGMAAIPFGLLVALTRFRLWEADRVISRSAAYAVVTLVVGVVWAASSDLVKLIITEVMGRESEAGATTVGAVIAAGIFSPTQSVVLGWTRRHFGSPLDRIAGAADRIKAWGLAETPTEVAIRSLELIDQAIHPTAAAIVIDAPIGEELLAARGTETADDPGLTDRLPIADDAGSVGTLLIGRRSDGNRYNRQELEAVRRIVPHLAEALRVTRSRHSRENMMQQRLDEMAARLAQLEGGAPKPA